MTENEREHRLVDTRLELRLDAPPERVWTALVEEAWAWWPASFYVGDEPAGFVVEAKVGGRVYEDWKDGAGLLWATVIAVRPLESLRWAGDLSAEYGGPARSIVSFSLKQREGGGTLLELRDTAWGCLDESAADALDEGWRFLLTECLQPWIEEGAHPERPKSVERTMV